MQKRIIAGLLTCVALNLSAAEFHDFTSATDGRVVRAEIVDFNDQSGMVSVKLENGRVIKVNPNVFSEADQQFINDWKLAKCIQSDRSLKITFKKNLIDRKKEPKYGTIYYAGGPEKEVFKTTITEQFTYDITLQNMAETVLDNLRMEYRIYYEQSAESKNKPEFKQHVTRGEKKLSALLSRKKMTVVSDPVSIYKESINAKNLRGGDDRIGGKGDIHGIRLRIILKMESGAEYIREETFPASLSDEYSW